MQVLLIYSMSYRSFGIFWGLSSIKVDAHILHTLFIDGSHKVNDMTYMVLFDIVTKVRLKFD